MNRSSLALVFQGNWRKISGFAWIDPPEDKENYGIYHLDHKNSGIKAICNATAILKRMIPFEGTTSRDVIRHTFAHFGVGWINAIAVRVFQVDFVTRKNKEEFTPAFRELHKIMDELIDNPIIDVEYYKKMLIDVTIGNIEHLAEEEEMLSLMGVPDKWPIKAYEWFLKNNPTALEDKDDRGGWPTTEEMAVCLMDLGIMNPEYEPSEEGAVLEFDDVGELDA